MRTRAPAPERSRDGAGGGEDAARTRGPSGAGAPCARCGGDRAPTYPLAAAAVAGGRRFVAGERLCLHCTCEVRDANTTDERADEPARGRTGP